MTSTLPPVDFTPFGLAIGHATDDEGATGCTVVRGIDAPFRASAALVGRASGTRELAVLSPAHHVERIDAILLTGGSAYGLDAAAGVMRWMEERGRGYAVGAGLVPIVPAAVVFDLAPFGRFSARPTPAMAYEACERATSRDVAEGSVGAGTGTTVGKLAGIEHAMKGGIGCGYAVADDPRIAVCAIAAVNALGDVRGADGRIIAGARAHDGGFVDAARMIARGGASAAPQRFRDVARSGDAPLDDVAGRNTTIAVVAVTTPLTRVELQGLASAATAALYRRITPCGTIFDGDVVFAVSPMTASPGSMPDVPPPILQLEALAVEALEQAIERAVRTAKGRDGIPGLADA